jgi:hypothetical protein
MQNLVDPLRVARRATAGASYTLEEAELCDRLPHKSAAGMPECAFL